MQKNSFILMMIVLISSCGLFEDKEKQEAKQRIYKEVDLEKKKDKAFGDLEQSADKLRKKYDD